MTEAKQIDKIHALMEEGNRARAILPIMLDYIDKAQNEIIQNLLSRHRTETLTAELMYGKVGELVGLENLLLTTKSKIAQVAAQEQKEFGQ